MQVNTFIEAVDLAFEEVWVLQQERDAFENSVGKGELDGESPEMVNIFRRGVIERYSGASTVLGSLLHASGKVGRRSFPAAFRPLQPDPLQVQIRLVQWALDNGKIQQGEHDQFMADEGVTQALKTIGQDFLD
ncbi:hypothetical protein SEA_FRANKENWEENIE_188 [Streptomyces phage Frankenweenie]|nr:hypothetical protein SEA_FRANKENWEENIE_188 [Streptomyces phage Frankenweenie]